MVVTDKYVIGGEYICPRCIWFDAVAWRRSRLGNAPGTPERACAADPLFIEFDSNGGCSCFRHPDLERNACTTSS